LRVKKDLLVPDSWHYPKYEYSPCGRQKAVTDANGIRAGTTYGGFDRQRRRIFPSNRPGPADPADD
jgi:hypothetical protein